MLLFHVELTTSEYPSNTARNSAGIYRHRRTCVSSSESYWGCIMVFSSYHLLFHSPSPIVYSFDFSFSIPVSILLHRSLLSDFLNSVCNTHSTLPSDKLSFMLSLLNGPVKLFETEGILALFLIWHCLLFLLLLSFLILILFANWQLHRQAFELPWSQEFNSFLVLAASRKCLVPTLVSHLVSFVDHMMPRTGYKLEDSSNQSCSDCIARLLNIFAEKREVTTFQDIEHVVPFIFPLVRLCKLLPRTNVLAVSHCSNYRNSSMSFKLLLP